MRQLEHRLENKQTYSPANARTVENKLNQYNGKPNK